MSTIIIANRYQLQEKIGEGGVSIVYRALDLRLHTIVALKILREQYVTDPSFVTRFANEAHAIAALVHPNIVGVCDYDQTGPLGIGGINTYYIAMTYIDGPTLKQYIAQQQQIPADEAVFITSQILRGLGAAHAKGIIHRDVKSQNILLAHDGTALITDFGIAKILTTPSLTEQGMTVGTAAYIAPEQAQGLEVGPPADIYGTGIILYEMLTGHVPFEGVNPVEVAMKQVYQPPRSPRELNPAISPALEAIVLHALEKDPAQRYQTAGEMIASLASLNPGTLQTTDHFMPVATTLPLTAITTAPLAATPGSMITQVLPVTGRLPVVHAAAPLPAGVVPVATSLLPPPQPVVRPQSRRAVTAQPFFTSGRLLILLLPVMLLVFAFLAVQLFSHNLFNAEQPSATVPSIAELNPTPAIVSSIANTPAATASTAATAIVVLPPATATPPPASPIPPTATPVLPTPTATAIPPTPLPTLVSQPAFVVQPVNLREGPGTNYTIITGLPANTQLTILGSDGDWAHVHVDATGATGWVVLDAITMGNAPTPVPPTATPVPPLPTETPTPIPPTPTPTLVPVPTDTPVPVAVSPQGQIQLNAGDFSGGYRNLPPNKPYQGRIAVWIYGARSGYNTMQTSFTLQQAPDQESSVVLVVDGQDSEDAAKTPIQIYINGVQIYDGPDKLPNSNSSPTGNWGQASYTVPPGVLHPGQNTLTFVNVADDNRTGGPYNWMMLDYVLLVWR